MPRPPDLSARREDDGVGEAIDRLMAEVAARVDDAVKERLRETFRQFDVEFEPSDSASEWQWRSLWLGDLDCLQTVEPPLISGPPTPEGDVDSVLEGQAMLNP